MRLGYACINMTLPTRFKTCRLATLEREGINKVKEIVLHNLQNVIAALEWNVERGIYFYRLSSELVPLASHPKMSWTWWEDEDVLKYTEEISRFRQLHNMRLSMHPGQYTVLSTNREEVLINALADLEYHDRFLNLVGGSDMIIHGGGAYGDLEAAKKRFITNYRHLSGSIKGKLRLENDDRVYSLTDVLDIYKACSIPICLDIHHHTCHHHDETEEQLTKLIEMVFTSWTGFGRPKMHISSGKSGPTDRSHHDYVLKSDYERLLKLLNGREVDIMFEAKQKELAVLRILSET